MSNCDDNKQCLSVLVVWSQPAMSAGLSVASQHPVSALWLDMVDMTMYVQVASQYACMPRGFHDDDHFFLTE